MQTPTILIVDDTPKNIQVVAGTLTGAGEYHLLFATDGAQAVRSVKENRPDLVLMDIMMPEVDGLEACRRLKADPATKGIPVIFLTAKSEPEHILEGFKAGGVDYVTKPFHAEELLARVATHLQLRDYQLHLEERVEEATEEIRNLSAEIEATQREVVYTMGEIAETRSKETGNHVKRVAEYSRILALAAGLPPEEAELLKQASPMHDIGKVGIPDAVLNKPGKLDPEEWTIMQTHAQLGYDMLNYSERPILKAAAIVSREHHEKYNGKGYPRGLKGEEIHIYGRITAVADVFDALGSDRCYKKAWEDERIFNLFREERGEHFDPRLVDFFFLHLQDFLAVREKFQDPVDEN